MPSGDEEEIAVRDEEFFRFVALLATRVLQERPTLNPSLIRDQLRLMASVASNRPALMWELRLGLRTYANLVADARFQSNRPVKHRLGAEASRSFPLPRPADRGPQHWCVLVRLSVAIQNELLKRGFDAEFPRASNQVSMQLGLTQLAQDLKRRLVLLFDDAAHIGREKPLEVFFDLFRTLSSNLTSCKASIYPGVTKFGVRFDVFNDSTVIDISRSDVSSSSTFFPEVVRARYPKLGEREIYSDRLSPSQFANLLGRAVVGNMRAFILACNRFEYAEKIGIPDINRCLLNMATDYYWPLMEEVAPKLGVYEPLVEPARELFEAIVANLRDRHHRGAVPDRVLIHRQIIGNYAKLFEILEYLGFMARREASRAMKSGGRGPVFALNLCNLIEGGAVSSRLRGSRCRPRDCPCATFVKFYACTTASACRNAPLPAAWAWPRARSASTLTELAAPA